MSQLEVYKQKAAHPDYFRNSGDGLLFACLQSVATDKDFDIAEYFGADGQVFRNPDMARGRLLGPRESTISRDMFVGLFCYCFHFGRVDILTNIWAYGWRHGWKMGREMRKWDNRTWFTPGLVLLLAALIAHLKGRQRISSLLVNIWQPIGFVPGYQSHLAMLHIYLNRRIRGKTATWEHKALDRILKHSPRNALALALRGWHEDARAELAAQWPADRLPTKHDWTEEWRTQRADNDVGIVWGEPGNITPHSGGDLLFVEHVLAM